MAGKIERKELGVGPSRVELKGADDGPGTMRLYLSTFGNWDRVRPVPEMPEKGAFKKYLKAFINEGFFAHGHEHKGLPIGTIKDAGEDDYGFWVEMEFHSTPDAQWVRTVVKERIERGKAVKTSMGFVVHKQGYAPIDDPELKAEGITRGRVLKEIEVLEGSVVNIPANPQAIVTAVKSAEDAVDALEASATSTPEPQTKAVEVKGMFEEELSGRNNSMYALYDVLCCVIWRLQDMASLAVASGMIFDLPGLLHEALDEFSSRVAANILADVAKYGDGSMDFTSLDVAGITAVKVRLVDGLAFGGHLEAVVDAAERIATRAKAREELRVKEGRQLSSANRSMLEGLHGSIKDVLEMLTGLLESTTPKKDEEKAEDDTEEGEKGVDTAYLLTKARALEIGLGFSVR